MKRLIAVCAVLTIGALPVSAQETVAPAAAPALHAMRFENGALNGPGADLILADVPPAQFILVGEDHDFADPPEIALALAKAARPTPS
jgi:hypothetical protein